MARNTRIVLCIWCICAALGFSGTARAVTWSSPQTLVPPPPPPEEIGFDIASAGPGHYVLAWQEAVPHVIGNAAGSRKGRPGHRRLNKPSPLPTSGDPVFAETTDQGLPFGPPQQLGLGFLARAAVASDGTAIVAFLSHGVVFASLRPPGGSFGAPIPISGRRATYYNLDMSSSGTAVMTWLSKRHHREKAFATARPPGGQFGRSELLARFGHRGVLYPFLDVNESGGAVIAWSGPKGDIAAVKDAGHSFRPAQLIPHSAFSTSDSSVAMAPNGTAIDIINGGPEAENVRAAIRRPGRRFKRPVLVGNHNFAFGEIAADASNHFLLLMDTADSLGRASDPVTRYYSNGSFGPPIRVFSVSPALFAVLGMNPAGDAVVSAIDNTYPATTDYVMASYGHGGQSFEQSAFLSDALTEDKGFSEATMDGAGTALVSWIDNSGALVTSVGKP